jgi:effector-binding domain-containing protein
MLTISEFARLGQVSPRMLRHYDETGLLAPARVDAQTGYRFYDVAQLGRLHVADQQARLRLIEAHLRALERSQNMELPDIVIKQSEPVRLAEAVGTAPGFGTENIAPVFRPLLQEVYGYLVSKAVRPGINIARYEGPAEDGSVTLHVGLDIGAADVADSEDVHIVDLPAVRVAAVVHRGTMEDIAAVFEVLVTWAKDSGYTMDGPTRELYHHWDDQDPAGHVTELQLQLAP